MVFVLYLFTSTSSTRTDLPLRSPDERVQGRRSFKVHDPRMTQGRRGYRKDILFTDEKSSTVKPLSSIITHIPAFFQSTTQSCLWVRSGSERSEKHDASPIRLRSSGPLSHGPDLSSDDYKPLSRETKDRTRNGRHPGSPTVTSETRLTCNP